MERLSIYRRPFVYFFALDRWCRKSFSNHWWNVYVYSQLFQGNTTNLDRWAGQAANRSMSRRQLESCQRAANRGKVQLDFDSDLDVLVWRRPLICRRGAAPFVASPQRSRHLSVSRIIAVTSRHLCSAMLASYF